MSFAWTTNNSCRLYSCFNVQRKIFNFPKCQLIKGSPGVQDNTLIAESKLKGHSIKTFAKYTLHYTTLHYTTLHYTTLHYTTLHYTTLHYTTLHYTTLHYTTLHYTTLHCTIFVNIVLQQEPLKCIKYR